MTNNSSTTADSTPLNEKLTLTFKKIQDEDICLFSQESQNNSKKLNEWTVHYPSKTIDDSVQFYLKNLNKMFLGKMNEGLDIKHIQQLDSNSFKTKLPSFKYIKPGLNYRIVCKNDQCSQNDKMVIINQGYGRFKPNVDLDEQKLRCPTCFHNLDSHKSIRLIILFRAKGSIQFNEQNQIKQSEFNLDSNSSLKVFDGETSLVKYEDLEIDANENYQHKEGVDEVKVEFWLKYYFLYSIHFYMFILKI